LKKFAENIYRYVKEPLSVEIAPTYAGFAAPKCAAPSWCRNQLVPHPVFSVPFPVVIFENFN
jgi:hypothetical protein